MTSENFEVNGVRETSASGAPPHMSRLISDLRRVVRPGRAPQDTADDAGDLLASYLAIPGLLAARHTEPDPDHYRQHIIHAEEDGSFSVVSLVWLPGQRTPVHDHVAWCVVGVYQGEETETRFSIEDDDGTASLVPVGCFTNGLGSISSVAPPGDIHEVYNSCSQTTVSIHIYGADISRHSTSIRRQYRLPIKARPPSDNTDHQ